MIKIKLSLSNISNKMLESINNATIIATGAIKTVHSGKDGITVVRKNIVTTAMGAGGAKQLGKSILCGDGPCTVVSCVGLACDGINLVSSYVPNCKAIQGISFSVSVGCKTFVYLCDGGLSPWNKFC